MPSKLTGEYRVEVGMTAEPFAFDSSKPTILKGSDLEKLIERNGGRMKKDEAKE